MNSTPEWYDEPARRGLQQRVRVTATLYKGRSAYQEIRIVETEPFGRALILDNAIQTTERDEFFYHEMLVHPAAVAHAEPRRALVIGGGDGGCLRRVLEHPVERAVLVDIDGEVVRLCRQLLPSISAGAFEDARTELVIGDGLEYVAAVPAASFDLIIVDSTDPAGPGARLIAGEFFEHAHRLLTREGIFATQSGSPLYGLRHLRTTLVNLGRHFPCVRVALGLVPAYPGVLHSFAIAAKRGDPAAMRAAEVERRLKRRGVCPRYYSAAGHGAAFVLPPFVRRMIETQRATEPFMAEVWDE